MCTTIIGRGDNLVAQELDVIHHINCLDAFKDMTTDSVDYVFTSPPYNRKRNDKYTFYDDDVADYKTFILEVIRQSLRVSKDYVFFNIQKNYYNKQEVFELIGEFAGDIIDIFIWNKTNPMPASGNNITNSYEYVLVLSKVHKTLKSKRTYTKNVITTNVYSSNPYRKVHRAVMHPDLARSLFTDFMVEGKIVLDPFMGVGTTAEVAKESGLYYIGFELVHEYIEVAEQRMRGK